VAGGDHHSPVCVEVSQSKVKNRRGTHAHVDHVDSPIHQTLYQGVSYIRRAQPAVTPYNSYFAAMLAQVCGITAANGFHIAQIEILFDHTSDIIFPEDSGIHFSS
jgi:hypothetical protein